VVLCIAFYYFIVKEVDSISSRTASSVEPSQQTLPKIASNYPNEKVRILDKKDDLYLVEMQFEYTTSTTMIGSSVVVPDKEVIRYKKNIWLPKEFFEEINNEQQNVL
jgi:hypothetical protein